MESVARVLEFALLVNYGVAIMEPSLFTSRSVESYLDEVIVGNIRVCSAEGISA